MPRSCSNPVSGNSSTTGSRRGGRRSKRSCARTSSGATGCFSPERHFGLYRRCAGSGRRGFALRGGGGGSHDRHHHPSGLLVHSGAQRAARVVRPFGQQSREPRRYQAGRQAGRRAGRAYLHYLQRRRVAGPDRCGAPRFAAAAPARRDGRQKSGHDQQFLDHAAYGVAGFAHRPDRRGRRGGRMPGRTRPPVRWRLTTAGSRRSHGGTSRGRSSSDRAR